ncbi:hypothetical protein [Shewanella atlantica]|uniref:Uncharacterized protein n=1 Tax=Shewanella atlantica TaxID=271099 RepID=A0A431VZ26_9GAMM|nr:hypothetical protein [Shewanella atlantica]RTR28527.1 hypothetical protein EKG39_18455 [Shewanella atlantica]
MITVNESEDFNSYKLSYEFSLISEVDEIFASDSFVKGVKDLVVNYALYIHDESEIVTTDWSVFHSKCLDVIDDGDSCKIALVIDKNDASSFTVINSNAFSKYLNSINYIVSATTFLSEIIKYNYTVSFYDGEKLSVLELERATPIEIKNSMVSKSALLFKFFSDGGNPDLMFDWSRQFENEFGEYLLNTSSLLMLSRICTDFDVESKTFLFSGYKDLEVKFEHIVNDDEQKDILQTVYQWVYSGQEESAKLGILSNVISLFSTRGETKLFDQNLKRTIFSNYKIYLKENVERYIEVKNKVSEFVFELSNKIVEYTDSFRGEVKKSVFAVYGFFFMSIVFTGIDKGKVNNIFTLEVSSLTILFLVAAIFYIYVSRTELIKKVEFAEEQLKDLEKRYSAVLDSSELEDVFERGIISKIHEKFSENGIFFFGITLCFLLMLFIIAGLLFNVGLVSVVGEISAVSRRVFY